MEFFKSNTKIPFMQQRLIAAVFSIIIFVISIYSLATNGLNLGLDFTGGTQVDVTFASKINITDVRKEIVAVFPKAQVQASNDTSLRIRVAKAKDDDKDQKTSVIQQIKNLLPKGGKVDSAESIGPSVGKQLLTNGILAVLFSLFLTMLYIAFRFEYRFAISAALALIHDPILILGIFSYFHLEFNMIVLTAVLTVIGYSLNDTIVVYDRVRENFRKMRKTTPADVMDASINQTLSRTIMTSGLTLLVVIALFVYGGDTVHGFALALIIGIVIGTYSSIYVAGSIAIALGLNRQSLLSRSKFITTETFDANNSPR